ncbi:hypothetical protein DFAR_3090004 [Desulfarculales bacterium]
MLSKIGSQKPASVVVWLCQKPTIPRPRGGTAMARVASLFSQLLHNVPLIGFSALIKEYGY